LFSVGAILYEMLTGEPPHTAPTYEAVLIAICTKDAPDVRGKAPHVPEKLARVVARAMKRDRAERYASASDMLADLEATLHESRALAVKTRTAQGVWPDAAPKSAPPDRYRTLVWVVVAALGGFSVAAYFVARGNATPVVGEVTPGAAASKPPAAALPSPRTVEAAASSVAPASPIVSKPIAKTPASKPNRETAKPSEKKPTGAPSAGVAGGLGLSTREP
jgi:serine/threonine protein kinase